MHIKKFFLSMLITCGIGVIISAYLLYIHYFPLIPDAALYSLCTAGSTFDCNAVNTSAYAMLFGMPLAAWGMAFYLFFIAVILIYTIKTKHVILEFSMMWLAIFAVLLSVVLGYISFVKIQKFCSFCMALWLCNVALLTLVLIYIALLYKGLIRGINTIHDFTVATLFADSKLRGTIVVLVIAAVVSLLVAWGIDGTLQLAYNQKQKQREAIILQEFKKEYTMFERVAIPVDGTIPVIGKKEYPVHILFFLILTAVPVIEQLLCSLNWQKNMKGRWQFTYGIFLWMLPVTGLFSIKRMVHHAWHQVLHMLYMEAMSIMIISCS